MKTRAFVRRRKSTGFTLMEVLLSLGVLMFGLSVVFQLITVSQNAAVGAEELAIVQLAVQTQMNEVLASNHDSLSTRNLGRIPNVKNWEMRIEKFPLKQPGVVGIRIRAEKHDDSAFRSDHYYELVRWVLGPAPSFKDDALSEEAASFSL